MATSPVGCRLWLPPVSSGWCHPLPVSSGGGAGFIGHQLHRVLVAAITSFARLVLCSTDRVGRGWFRRPPASSGWCLLLPVSSGGGFIRCRFISRQFRRAGVTWYQFHPLPVSSGRCLQRPVSSGPGWLVASSSGSRLDSGSSSSQEGGWERVVGFLRCTVWEHRWLVGAALPQEGTRRLWHGLPHCYS